MNNINKTQFVCGQCGHHSVKWLGKCPSCEEWNTFQEEKVHKPKSDFFHLTNAFGKNSFKAIPLSSIENNSSPRLLSPDFELNRVLGGGIVLGSLVLLGGEPGIGKSTLLLQLALSLTQHKVLYVSGEESGPQLKMRANRITSEEATIDNCFILTETNLTTIIEQVDAINPELVIVDSIQTIWTPMVESSPGSISQVRECTAGLLRIAKIKNIPIFIIGHITKDGTIAGPKILEHMVDTVLQFEGDRHHYYRILRTLKNRFGSTSELGIYEMQGEGLKQVPNPSEILLSPRDESLSGISITAVLEGSRVIVLESQALISPSVFGTPQRSSIGFDPRRMNMLLAVLEKKCGFRLGMQDVFLNITGGIKVEDPAIDLCLVVSILSSFLDIPIPNDYCFTGEIGLSGELRAIHKIEQRIQEAKKLGFKQIFIPKMKGKKLANQNQFKIVEISKLEDLVDILFKGSS